MLGDDKVKAKVGIQLNKEQLVKDIMKEIERKCKKQLSLADDKLIQEFTKMYEQMIDQYYTYVTQYYYRHETGKGTGTGMNLYRASDMHMDIGGGHFIDNIVFNLNENEMEEYKTTSIEQVLENVMNGWRREVGGVNTFIANVEFCGMYFSGTPNEILDQIQASGIIEQYRYKIFIEAVAGL